MTRVEPYIYREKLKRTRISDLNFFHLQEIFMIFDIAFGKIFVIEI